MSKSYPDIQISRYSLKALLSGLVWRHAAARRATVFLGETRGLSAPPYERMFCTTVHTLSLPTAV